MIAFFAMRGSRDDIERLDAAALEAAIKSSTGREATSHRIVQDDLGLLLVSSVSSASRVWVAGRQIDAIDLDGEPSGWAARLASRPGGFSCVTASGSPPVLQAARDRRGIESLVFVHRGDLVAVASDVPTMLASGLVERKIDFGVLRFYLRRGYVPEPATLVAGLSVLPAGSLLTADERGVRIEPLPAPEPSSDDPRPALLELFAADDVALIGTASSAPGVSALLRMLAEAGLHPPVYSVGPVDGANGSTRRVAMPRGESELFDLLGSAFALPGQPSLAMVESALVARAATAGGATRLVSGAGRAAVDAVAPSGMFSFVVDRFRGRRPVAASVFDRPSVDALVGLFLTDTAWKSPEEPVAECHASHRARLRADQDAARSVGAQVAAPLLELFDPDADGDAAVVSTALPIAPFTEGAARTVLRELVFGLGQDSILLSSAVHDLWGALRDMPRLVDPARVWSLVTLGAWTRKHRITA